MMKRVSLLLLGLLTASALAFVACDDEPTQEAANEQFCDDAADLIASLRAIRDLDLNSTVDEIDAARESARDAYADMIASAEGVVDVRLDDLQAAYDQLAEAVENLDEGTTLEDALDEVDEEIENVALEASQVLNEVDCGGSGSGSQSDE